MTALPGKSEKLQAMGALALLLVAAGFLGVIALGPRGRVRVAWQAHMTRRAQARLLGVRGAELAELGHWFGPRTASHVVYEFSDYQCPFCRMVDSTVADWVGSQPDVAVLYLDLPIRSLHPNAFDASLAAGCAEMQGRYPQMHRRLMTSTAWQRDKNWVREAQAAGVPDTAAFTMCVVGRAGTGRIERTMTLADSLGVTATPWFFGRSGLFHAGALTQADLAGLK